MTENKRFKCGQGKISVVGENLIFKLLSLFAEENQELRTKNNTYIQDVKEYREENTHLKLENEKLKKSKKGQELEIVRLHHLADAMSGVLRELGIYDVYNKEQINKVKKELKQ